MAQAPRDRRPHFSIFTQADFHIMERRAATRNAAIHEKESTPDGREDV